MYIQIGSTHVIIVVVRDLRSIYSHYLSERRLLLLLLDEHFLLHRYDQTLHFIDQSMIIVSLDRSSSIDRSSILELATFPGLASLESRPNIPPMFSWLPYYYYWLLGMVWSGSESGLLVFMEHMIANTPTHDNFTNTASTQAESSLLPSTPHAHVNGSRVCCRPRLQQRSDHTCCWLSWHYWRHGGTICSETR